MRSFPLMVPHVYVEVFYTYLPPLFFVKNGLGRLACIRRAGTWNNHDTSGGYPGLTIYLRLYGNVGFSRPKAREHWNSPCSSNIHVPVYLYRMVSNLDRNRLIPGFVSMDIHRVERRIRELM